jgi:hypothetical protein
VTLAGGPSRVPITITFDPSDQGTRTFHFEKNTVDEAVTDNHRGFEAQKELTQKEACVCYFDGITNFEGRHGIKPLVDLTAQAQELRERADVTRDIQRSRIRTSEARWNEIRQGTVIRWPVADRSKNTVLLGTVGSTEPIEQHPTRLRVYATLTPCW